MYELFELVRTLLPADASTLTIGLLVGCGLFGYQLKEPDARVVPAMAVLSLIMDSRGKHSWGFWTPEMILQKGLGLFHHKVPSWLFKDTTYVMAHCRYATVGAITKENSHPFEVGDVIGAHNGSVYNHRELKTKYKRDDYDVDSQHIFGHLAEKRKMKEIEGNGAITWLDRRINEGRLNLCRFNAGSLAAARIYEDADKDHKDRTQGVFWASTDDALESAMGVSGFNFDLVKVVNDKIHYIENGEIFLTQKDINISSWTSTTPANNNKDNQSSFPIRGPLANMGSPKTTTNTGTPSVGSPGVISRPFNTRPSIIPDDAPISYWTNNGIDSRCLACHQQTKVHFHQPLTMLLCYPCWLELQSPTIHDELVHRTRAIFTDKIKDQFIKIMDNNNDTDDTYQEGIPEAFLHALKPITEPGRITVATFDNPPRLVDQHGHQYQRKMNM